MPVIAVAFAGAMFDMFPELRSRPMAITLTVGAMWAMVLVNLRGVSAAGLFAEITTYAKLVPFGAVAILGLFFVDGANLSEFNPSGEPLMSAAATLYVLGTVVVLGVVPREQLVGSTAPFSDAARMMWGPWAATGVSLAVILSSIGALNGWTLLMGQVPMAAARDGLFPPVFGRLSSRGVPAAGIVISAAFATVLTLVQAQGGGGFKSFYEMVVGLCTMAAVIPYAFCALAAGLVAAQSVVAAPAKLQAQATTAQTISPARPIRGLTAHAACPLNSCLSCNTAAVAPYQGVMIMSVSDDQGTIVALLERFRLQRLPAALEIKERVSAGEKLTGHDIQFLEQVFEDVRDVQPLLERHPELKTLTGQVAALYKEITEAALANEKGA